MSNNKNKKENNRSQNVPRIAGSRKEKKVEGSASHKNKKDNAIRTKYFPSKNMIHDVVTQARKKDEKLAEQVEKSKTIDERQRPATATLEKVQTVTPTSICVDYEDDFESYESDFDDSISSTNLLENASSESSESFRMEIDDLKIGEKRPNITNSIIENKLDSGAFEMTTTELPPPTPLTSLPEDEGYDERVKRFDFEKAQTDRTKREMLKRGREILTMIRLNTCYATIFDMHPLPYDASKGITYKIKTFSQTGITKIDENVQTECIQFDMKWTQAPPVIVASEEENWERYREGLLGVGRGGHQPQTIIYHPKIIQLDKFKNLLNATRIILDILCRKEFFNANSLTDGESSSTPLMSVESTKILAYDFPLLRDSKLVDVCCIKNRGNCQNNVLTIHVPNNKKDNKSFLTIWNVLNLEKPLEILTTSGCIKCADFGYENQEKIFAGLEEGTVCLWDVDVRLRVEKYGIHTPNCTTPIAYGHETSVTSIKSLPSQNSNYFQNQNEFCSLDLDGILIFWGIIIIKKRKVGNRNELSLVQNLKLELRYCFSEQFLNFHFNCLNPKHLYFLINSDEISHRLINGVKSYPKYYVTGELSRVKCMDVCPFSSDYFVAGYENGKLALFSRNSRNSLMLLSNGGNGKMASIDLIQWSTEKPCIFYAKDSNNVLHVWNLALSDIYPLYSIPFKEKIISFKLSSFTKNKRIFLVMATLEGEILVHFLNNDHKSINKNEYEADVKYFFNYVNRL